MLAGEGPVLGKILYRSVHGGTAGHTTAAQRRAWAPAPSDLTARLAGQTVVVAVADGMQLGFMSLTAEGLIDLAYVRPEYVGQGVGARLYDRIEAEGRAAGHATLTTEASTVAYPFFLKRGWRVVVRQSLRRNGVELTNFRMRKRLSRPP